MPPNAGPPCHAPCPALLEVAVGKTKEGPTPARKPELRGIGKTARSNKDVSPNSVRLPPRELGTVTRARVGRIICTNGSSDSGGTRGMRGLMVAMLVCTLVP